MSGDGKTYKWDYFIKIVAAPSDAMQDASHNWVLNGKIIGPAIWNEFATIMEVYNDQGTVGP